MTYTRYIIDEPAVADDLDLLHSLHGYPAVREKLHTICALYAHTPQPRRLAILESLEVLLLSAASELAGELLEMGWRPTGKSGPN